jgi:nucleotide-binding universal stress UspA family protein
MPLNLHFAGREWPVGLALTTMLLGMVAIANLFSKRIATIWGISFTIVFFVLFTVSERINLRRLKQKKAGLEEFNLDLRPEIACDAIHARPGCVLVAVRDYSRLAHLETVLQKTKLRRHDIVVMTVRPVSTGAGEYELSQKQLFSDYEQELFSRVVTVAEKQGKTVDLLVVPGVDPFDAMVQAAQKLQASRLVTGVSSRMDSEELARRIGQAWERLPEPRHPFSLEVISPGRPSIYVNLGPHPPRLWPEDLDRLHDLWLRLSEDHFGSKLHHRDVIGAALRRLEKDLDSDRRTDAIEDLNRELRKD